MTSDQIQILAQRVAVNFAGKTFSSERAAMAYIEEHVTAALNEMEREHTVERDQWRLSSVCRDKDAEIDRLRATLNTAVQLKLEAQDRIEELEQQIKNFPAGNSMTGEPASGSMVGLIQHPAGDQSQS